MAILMVTIKDDDELDRALGIPIIYTIMCWIINALYIWILYKIGWTFNVNDNKNSNEKEELNLCILIKRYKETKIKRKQEKERQKENEQGSQSQVSNTSRNQDAVEDVSTTNIITDININNNTTTKNKNDTNTANKNSTNPELAINSKETKHLQHSSDSSSDEISEANQNNQNNQNNQTVAKINEETQNESETPTVPDNVNRDINLELLNGNTLGYQSIAASTSSTTNDERYMD